MIARAGGLSFWQEYWLEYLVGFAIGFAFWGFGMFGLLVGFALTYPMNWMMVKIGWKHGMGGMEGAKKHEVEGAPRKTGLVAAMVVLGFAALALDGALRAAEVGAHSAPGSFYSTLEQVWEARIALQLGDDSEAMRRIGDALQVLRPAGNARPPLLEVRRYAGARVLDAEGAFIGEVTGVSRDSLELALGGWRDAWGFVDFGSGRRASVPVRDLAFGPPRVVGLTLVALPTEGSAAAAR